MPSLIIHAVTFSDEEPSVLSSSVRSLFKQYASDMKTLHNVDLSFQEFNSEVSSLPGLYSYGSRGGVWVAVLPPPPSSSSGSGSDQEDELSSFGDDMPFSVVPPHALLPGGRVIRPEDIVGVIALRPLEGEDGEEGEVKRMYVRAEARGKGVGKALVKVRGRKRPGKICSFKQTRSIRD